MNSMTTEDTAKESRFPLAHIRVDGIWLVRESFEDKALTGGSDIPDPTSVSEAGAEMGIDVQGRLVDHETDDEQKVAFVEVTLTIAPNLQPSFEASVTCLARYSFGSDASLPRDKFLRRNGIAMLFPFLRERIASMTSQSRFKTLLLPAVNVSKIPELLLKSEREEMKTSREGEEEEPQLQ